MTKVMVFGTFDLLHPGHVFFLTEAKKFGSYLTAVIARDSTVAAVKGRRAQNNELKRQMEVQALNIADKVILGRTREKYRVILEENPDVIVLGYDQNTFTDGLRDELFKKIKVVRMPAFRPDEYKSSKLRAKD